jgi:two-component system response regulator HydG
MERNCGTTCSICGLVPLACVARRQTTLVARSLSMQAMLRRAGRFARSDAPVAVLGETGSGKEIVARALHASSRRADAPFVAVNVAALPTELLESELFGHARGAFTGAAGAKRGLFEEASGGTLFLDEIGELSLPLQAKLLRALQDGEVRRVGETRAFAVDVRIICATHRSLDELVRRGSFREDLFFRLKVLSVRVPPLRERVDDILPLAEQFLADERGGHNGFADDARTALRAHDWPGNVRELQNAVKHGAALATGNLVTAADLPEELLQPKPRATRTAGANTDAATLRPLADVEHDHILRVLDACGGSQAEAARVLGIARNTLWRKLRSYH